MSGLNRLRSKLRTMSRDAGRSRVAVVVGYTQSYALAVHELDAKHAEGKQKKYLEQPARTLRKELALTIRQKADQGDLAGGMLLGALRLQRESQEIVPIDTGALKASAFTAIEEEVDIIAAEAYSRSEAIRIAELQKRKKGDRR